ncbi:MAG: multiple sugar transport system permease protein [Frankiaceae bacterium]|jgi:multiple sugar transport system permease protein|nr:multiple sugar transport system permease protein [Frankiaceae bacterium]
MVETLTATPVRHDTKNGKAAAKPPRRKRQLLPYLLLVPAILLELLIHIGPMIVGVIISFYHLTQLYLANWRHAPAAGLDNYRVALNVNGAAGKALLHSFTVTLTYTVLVLGFSWLLGMTAAVLTQRAFRGRAIVRTLFLLPFALPIFASVITWNFMGQRDTGVINHVLVDQLHTQTTRPFWLIGPNSFPMLVAVTIWRTWPFAFLIISAGLQSIPDELYEAATLDGAGVMAQIRRVTLPLLAPVNRVLFVVLFLWTFNDFTTPYTLFGDTPPVQADLISLHIYTTSFTTWNFGTGSAMSVVLLLFLLLVTGIYLIVTNRRSDNA